MSKKLVDEQFDSDFPNEHPKNLIPGNNFFFFLFSWIKELCRHFYNLGWATGTGGGISIRDDDDIYIAPSGVQKERIRPQDLFMTDMAGSKFEKPRDEKLKLRYINSHVAFRDFLVSVLLFSWTRTISAMQARWCIPTLQKLSWVSESQLIQFYDDFVASLIFGNEFRISHIEMIKGKRSNSIFSNIILSPCSCLERLIKG